LQVGLFLTRQRHITRQVLESSRGRSAPDIGVTAQGVHAAASHPHVAEQQLDHRHGTDVLRADRVLGPAERTGTTRSYPARWFRQCIRNFQEVRLRRTADVFDHIRGIRETCCFSRFQTQRGCCSVVSRLAKPFSSSS
jgi:hypothetical protein